MQREPFAPSVTRSDLIQWSAAAAVLALVLVFKLLSALVAALLVYELVHVLAGLFRIGAIGRRKAKLFAVALLTTAVVLLLTFAVAGLVAALRHGSEGLPALLQKLAEIIESSRQRLPGSMVDYLPADADELRARLAAWLREHSGELRGAGMLAGRAFAHIFLGVVIGALLALRETASTAQRSLLGGAIAERAERLASAFRRVVFAQAWIAAINAAITAVYLLVALPLFGVHLPLAKSIVALTFVTGLIPIVGNLISNSVIVIAGFSSSASVAVTSLIFLVAVHKLGYFLNARIIGSHIRASAWELLIAMLVMEAVFGLSGLVAAPIFYAYFKDEFAAKGLV